VARLRTLKPSFFSDDVLAELSPLHRILFQGLWCYADREGRLKDRPRQLKAQVLPFDEADVESMLWDLHRKGFILRYVHGDGERAIQVKEFSKHQKPHPKEAASEIPAPTSQDWASREISRQGKTRVGMHENPGVCEPGGLGDIGLGDSCLSTSPHKTASPPTSEEVPLLSVEEEEATSTVGAILAHYLEAVGAAGFHAKATDDKRRLIRRRLEEGWKPDQLISAINGLTWSDWHMGRDPKTKGKRWCTLDYAIGDNKAIERWLNEQKIREAS
jgi:hypothetical protein